MQIRYKKKAEKYINTCDQQIKRRLKAGIEKLPFGDVSKLQGYDNEYRLRVLFTMEEDIITINDIKPRGQVYKRL